jgi:hypothetical protein
VDKSYRGLLHKQTKEEWQERQSQGPGMVGLSHHEQSTKLFRLKLWQRSAVGLTRLLDGKLLRVFSSGLGGYWFSVSPDGLISEVFPDEDTAMKALYEYLRASTNNGGEP